MRIINLIKAILITILTIAPFWVFGQVGINTTTPNPGPILDIKSENKGVFLPKVDITDLHSIDPVEGIESPAELEAAESLLVYNTNSSTGPGFFYWNGSQWTQINKPSAAHSVSLATNQFISGSSFSAVPGMSITFTAEKTEGLISLTASGFGYTNSLTIPTFRVYNNTTGVSLGGFNANGQSVYKAGSGGGATIYSVSTWSGSFSKIITGLTVGNSYTIVVQAKTVNIYGTDGIAIYPASYPDSDHLTLTVQF